MAEAWTLIRRARLAKRIDSPFAPCCYPFILGVLVGKAFKVESLLPCIRKKQDHPVPAFLFLFLLFWIGG